MSCHKNSLFHVLCYPIVPRHSLLISGRKMPQLFGPVSLLRECECAQYKMKYQTWSTMNYPHKAQKIQRDGSPILFLNIYHPRHGEKSLVLLLSCLQLV